MQIQTILEINPTESQSFDCNRYWHTEHIVQKAIDVFLVYAIKLMLFPTLECKYFDWCLENFWMSVLLREIDGISRSLTIFQAIVTKCAHDGMM